MNRFTAYVVGVLACIAGGCAIVGGVIVLSSLPPPKLEEKPNCLISPIAVKDSYHSNLVVRDNEVYSCSRTDDDKQVFCQKLVVSDTCKQHADDIAVAYEKSRKEEREYYASNKKKETLEKQQRWETMLDIFDTLEEFKKQKHEKVSK